MKLPEAAAGRLSEWRAKYPRPKIEEQSGNNPPATCEPGAMPQQPPAAQEASQIPAGSVKQNKDEVSAIGDTIVKECSLPDGTPASLRDLHMCLAKTPNGRKRVWLHNAGTKDLTVPVGTFLGRGGNGSFVALTNETIPVDKQRYAWKFTRITSHKRDQADTANGFLLWSKDGIAAGKPKPICMDEIEKQLGNDVRLYVHSMTRGQNQKRVTIVPSPTAVWWVADLSAIGDSDFDANVLVQFCLSGNRLDSASGKLDGLVRPVFEVQATAQPGGLNVLAPNPAKTSNPMFLFTLKKLELKAGQLVALHDL